MSHCFKQAEVAQFLATFEAQMQSLTLKSLLERKDLQKAVRLIAKQTNDYQFLADILQNQGLDVAVKTLQAFYSPKRERKRVRNKAQEDASKAMAKLTITEVQAEAVAAAVVQQQQDVSGLSLAEFIETPEVFTILEFSRTAGEDWETIAARMEQCFGGTFNPRSLQSLYRKARKKLRPEQNDADSDMQTITPKPAPQPSLQPTVTRLPVTAQADEDLAHHFA